MEMLVQKKPTWTNMDELYNTTKTQKSRYIYKY